MQRSLAFLLLSTACSEPRARDVVSSGGSIASSIASASDTGDGDATGSSSGGPASDGAAASDDGDDGGGTAPKLDVGDGAGSDGLGEGGNDDTGCHAVDLLFVIDDSISMDDEQAGLIAAFPDFIDAMQTELADTDGYHIGVVTTDEYAGDTSCGQARGTLVTRTGGTASSNAVCDPYSSGKRFMTEQDDLDARFACAAQVGTAGDPDERPMESMLAALSPGQLTMGGCNEGFLRNDALLVVVVVTDEEDDHEVGGCNALPGSGSVGDPDDWYQALVDVKGGVESSIVMLSIVGPDAQPLCPALDKCNIGSAGSEIGSRIIALTEMFTHGFVGSVCTDYGPQFQQAIAIIDSACDDFEPPA